MTKVIGIRKENLKSKQRKGERTMFTALGMGKEHLNSDEGGRTMYKALGMRWLRSGRTAPQRYPCLSQRRPT